MISPEILNDPSSLFWSNSKKVPEQKLDEGHGFSTFGEREKALYELCVDSKALTEACVDTLINDGFLDAPASTKYHGSYAGGLFDHSYNVATTLKSLTEILSLNWSDPNSPIRIGILHDLCKIDQYSLNKENDSYSYNTNTLITGHGIKSVVLAQQLPDVKLTEEEIACILYHMGAFTEKEEWKSYTNAIHTYPNVLWVHTADMVAAHILEVE